MTVADDSDQWLSTNEVGQLFSVSGETIRNWIAQGKFGKDGAIQINGYWRIKRSAVVAFARKNYGT